MGSLTEMKESGMSQIAFKTLSCYEEIFSKLISAAIARPLSGIRPN